MGRSEFGVANEGSCLADGAGRKSIANVSVVRLFLLPYLDPGSGSFLIQILIAAVLGGVVSVGLWFRRILGVFGRSPGGSPTDNGLETEESDKVGGEGGRKPGSVGRR